MNLFRAIEALPPISRFGKHDGAGPVWFRRMFTRSEFSTPIDFIDYTRIPAGTSIGRKEHHGNEEMYFVVPDSLLVRLTGETEPHIAWKLGLCPRCCSI